MIKKIFTSVLRDKMLFEKEYSFSIKFKEVEGSREMLGIDGHKNLLSLMKKA